MRSHVVCLFLIMLLLIPLSFYSAGPEREPFFLVGKENGIYYIVLNPKAYSYIYRNCYVCVNEKEGPGGCFYGLFGPQNDYFRILERLGVLDDDTSYGIYVSGPSNKSYIEPLPENITEYLSKLDLKVFKITSLRKVLYIDVYKDSSIKLPKDLIAELEKLPPAAENKKIVIIKVLPLTEEQGKRFDDIVWNKINKESFLSENGSLRSFCVDSSGFGVTLLPRAYVDGECMRKRNLSEKQVIDAIRKVVGDDSYPIEVIIDYTSFFKKAKPLVLVVNNSAEIGIPRTTVTYILLVSFATCTLLTSFLVAIIMFRKRKIRRT